MTEPAYTYPVEVNGRWVVRMPAHRAVRYLEEGLWERERIASMALNIAREDFVWDVGAEQGDMSALWQQWVGADGGVMLVEPNPAAWPTIKAIWDANDLPQPRGWYVGFASDVTADMTGPGPENGRVVGSERGWPSCALGEMEAAAGFRHLAEETDTTPQMRIDDLASYWGSPQVLTIDIEGAELVALRGAKRVLESLRPLVWVSVHPEFMRHHFGHRPRELHRYMEELDYRATHLGDDHESHWFYEPR